MFLLVLRLRCDGTWDHDCWILVTDPVVGGYQLDVANSYMVMTDAEVLATWEIAQVESLDQ